MAKLEKPRGLSINFSPSARQLEVWNALQPNRCDKCGGELTLVSDGKDKNGHDIYKPACKLCGNTDIPEQILSGGSAGGGKGQMLDSKVCTPFGFRKIRDLKVGDILSDPTTGGQMRVIYLHPIETRPYYRVKFIDGTHVDCTDNHLWWAHESRKKTKKAKATGINGKVWVTTAMYDWYQRKKDGMYEGMNLIIPLTEPVQFTRPTTPKTPRPLDPYILGVLIGDGSMGRTAKETGVVKLTTPDQFIVDKFEEAGYDMSHSSAAQGCRDYAIRNKELIAGLEKLKMLGCVANTKFIPEIYKMGTIEDRKKLMCGLMDTDGYVDDRGHMSYTTVSEKLADDVAFVARSLGAKCTITSDIGKYKDEYGRVHECQRAYTVYIMSKFDTQLVSLPRKKERARDEFNGGASELGKTIVDIEYIGEREGRCITVDTYSGLYITDNFTVTHNSYLGCCWLVNSCIRFEGIRMVVARKVRKTLIETTWKTLKDVLHEWGFEEGAHYHINSQAYVLTFWNGSEIVAMDLTPSPQDPDFNSLGSLEITGGFIDEVSEVSEKAVEVLASRIRYKIAQTFIVGKLLMSTNPCLGWVRKTFVMDDDGNPAVLSPGLRYIPFSLFDNPNPSFRAIYYNKLKKLRNKDDRQRLLYGDWRFIKANKMAAYWNFDGDKHLVPNLKERYYDTHKPLILSFDFNVDPYMSALPIQFDWDNKNVYIFPEYTGLPKDKRNNTPAFSRWIASQLMREGHVGGVLITGDPAGLHRSTQTEEGVNNYTIVIKHMSNNILQPKLNVLSRQPAHLTRLEFVNQLFTGFHGWNIMIDPRCHRLIEDFSYQQKNPDGTKEKKKVLNDEGKKVERWGHLSDCFDYGLVYYLAEDYQAYRTSSVDIVTTCEPPEDYPGVFDY